MKILTFDIAASLNQSFLLQQFGVLGCKGLKRFIIDFVNCNIKNENSTGTIRGVE